jgi:hypothetical protein
MKHGVEVAGNSVVSRASRVELVERLWAAAEAQVRAHEARLKGLGSGDAGSEAQAKSLATLARTIKELIEMDTAAIEVDRALEDVDNPHELEPGTALADLASLRAELQRRLEGIELGAAAELSGEPDTWRTQVAAG